MSLGKIEGANINLEGEEIKNISANIKATGNLDIKADKFENNRALYGYTYYEGSVVEGNAVVIKGLSGAQGATLAESIKNYAGSIYATAGLILQAKAIVNEALLLPKASGKYYSIVTKNTGEGAREGEILVSYQYGKAEYEISEGGKIESDGRILIKGDEVTNKSSEIKAAGDIEILADRVRNEVYSMEVQLKSVYDEYELYNVNEGQMIFGKPMKEKWALRKIGSREGISFTPLYASAGTLGTGALGTAGSLISGKNVSMLGLDGVS